MRQHRDHAIDKIYRRPALKCLYIERRALLHIVRHIRNMHTKAVVFTLHRERYRIIEILGVLAIDRDHLHASQILSARKIRLADRM